VENDNCNNYFPKDLCNPPLIATKGENAANGPDLEYVSTFYFDSSKLFIFPLDIIGLFTFKEIFPREIQK
jgi:hypothetical protein